jgi:hypothetical protein
MVPDTQVVLAFGEAATVSPDGNVSLNARLVSVALAFEFAMVKVRVELLLPSPGMLVGLNALPIVGADAGGGPAEARDEKVPMCAATMRATAAAVWIDKLAMARMASSSP